VHADCAVTREHCQEANGGLWFADAAEFRAAVQLLEQNRRLRHALGNQGRRYVLRYFTWEAVVQNYLEAFKQWDLPLDYQRSTAGLVPGTVRPSVLTVHQLLAGFRQGDAISQIALALQKTLQAWGMVSNIFAEHVHPDSRNVAYDLTRFDAQGQPGQVLLYHYSIHSGASEYFLQYQGKKIILYHNVTPAHFFAGYSDFHSSLMNLGRFWLPALIRAADLCLGDSRYNCLELEQYGAVDCRVLPPLLDLEALGRIRPDPQILRRFADGPPSILFVGRPVPNKRQDNVLRVFAHYRQTFDAAAQLVLVGGSDEASRYEDELRKLASELGLSRHVTFTGRIDDTQLVAYYRTARAFLSMSEHEGFGVPLVEAMYFNLPVVAYATTAVPYTLGPAGVLVHEPNVTLIAETLRRVMTEGDDRDQLLAGQRRRLKDFAPQKVQAMLKWYLDELLAK